MPASTDYELLARAADFTLRNAQEVEEKILKELETRADTPHVDALRMLTIQRTIVAIGTVQAFEGLLQLNKGWTNAFKELDAQMRLTGHVDLAERFDYLLNAINALKHGHGRSYNKLEPQRASLPFAVLPRGERFFNEGDVSEVPRLVDVDGKFVEQCSEIIREIARVIG
ncbi:hypothetical protein [Corallococcus silvisoli]|uniref:hypothetical protein n=1 Tax=Corallococcus silvisoli TaxID=2697031 RepID=UPI0013784BE8|nr:hypothetical protein [Corallococcus silvisoli]NBD09263.1 hypothetical protein [Corallococcus silvisoli]